MESCSYANYTYEYCVMVIGDLHQQGFAFTQNAGPCTLSDSWIGHKWIPLAFDYYLNVLVIYKACWVHSKQHSWNLTEHLSHENLFRTSPAKPTYSKGVTSSKSPFIVSLHQISSVFFLFTESFPHVWIGEIILCKWPSFYLSSDVIPMLSYKVGHGSSFYGFFHPRVHMYFRPLTGAPVPSSYNDRLRGPPCNPFAL